ncbi:MAG TPA: DUF3493 domain-containing protein [Leptolyngbyaceae cyanobacterium]
MDKLIVNPTWNAMSEPPSKSRLPEGMSAEKYARLRAEAKAPYKGLRKFVYGAVGASGAIGAFVFLTQLAAGRDVGTAFPNLLLQLGIVGLVIGLFRWENRDRKS